MNHFKPQNTEGFITIGPSVGLSTKKSFHYVYYDFWLAETGIFNAVYLDSAHKSDIYFTYTIGKENGMTAGYEHLLYKKEKGKRSLDILWFAEATISAGQRYIGGGIVVHPQYTFWVKKKKVVPQKALPEGKG